MLSPYLLASLVLTVLGIALFAYGRRVGSLGIGVGGIVLLLVPYVAFSAWMLWATCAVVFAVTIALRLNATPVRAR